jgi:hypothetical protein
VLGDINDPSIGTVLIILSCIVAVNVESKLWGKPAGIVPQVN